MKIHASGEDYLEAVLVLQKNHGAVRSIKAGGTVKQGDALLELKR